MFAGVKWVYEDSNLVPMLGDNRIYFQKGLWCISLVSHKHMDLAQGLRYPVSLLNMTPPSITPTAAHMGQLGAALGRRELQVGILRRLESIYGLYIYIL